MPSPKERDELLVVYAVRLPAWHVKLLRERQLSIGPLVRELVEKVLGLKKEKRSHGK
jgi:hypothetical protein